MASQVDTQRWSIRPFMRPPRRGGGPKAQDGWTLNDSEVHR